MTTSVSSAIKKRADYRGKVDKPDIIKEVIPEYITECALFLNKGANALCVDDATIRDIAKIVGSNKTDPVDILEDAATVTNCDSEKCVIKAVAKDLGQQRVSAIISSRFKLTGPTDITLLNNYNIDDTLTQFRNKFHDFFPYKFNMINYREYSYENGRVVSGPDTLETIRVGDLIDQYKTAACVINSDTYQGNGKHWMALFADWRDTDACTVEFFNSSGNAPAAPWILWMERTRDAFIAAGFKMKKIEENGFKCEIIRVTRLRHQNSQTECGIYSLFYIYSRLCGVPFDYFSNTFIPDQLMFEFRQHLFDGKNSRFSNLSGGKQINSAHKFDWDNYIKNVNIKWE